MWGKIVRNPVLLAGLILVILESFAAVADAQNLVNGTVSGWMYAGVVVITAILAFLTRAATTPVGDPKTADGRAAVLVPVEQIQLAEHKAIEHAAALRKAEQRAAVQVEGRSVGSSGVVHFDPDGLRHREF